MLKPIAAYREGETETVIDFDSANQPDFHVPAFYGAPRTPPRLPKLNPET